MRMGGDLSLETYLAEKKQMGVLNDEVEIEKEVKRIEAERDRQLPSFSLPDLNINDDVETGDEGRMLAGQSPGREVPMEQFLADILAAFVAGVLVAVVVGRWINRR